MDPLIKKKIIASAAIVMVALLAYSAQLDRAINAIPAIRTMNQECIAYLDDWSGKAIVTFGIAKGINSGLSVIEDSELQITAFGSGVTIAAGEAFRPLNDMVEKVASVSLASAVSLGIQRFLLEIGGILGIKWLLTLSMACLLIAIWAEAFTKIDLRRLAYGILMAAILVRFFIPVTVLATGYIGDQYMESAYATAQLKLDELSSETKKIDVLEDSGESKSKGLWSGFKSALSGARARAADLADRLAAMSDAYIGVAVDTMVVFVLQTMLMPILILWGLAKLLGFFLGSAARSGIEEKLLPFVGKTEKLTS